MSPRTRRSLLTGLAHGALLGGAVWLLACLAPALLPALERIQP